MEQSSAAEPERATVEPLGTATDSAARQVRRGLMRDLETHRLVPGQRLVETEIAAQYGVGRNAVREALQWLAAHGVIAAIRHRSSAIRRLDAAEALEVLDVAEALIALAASGAARRFDAAAHGVLLHDAFEELARADDADPGTFDRARRHFLSVLLDISGNRELIRLFPAFALHILFAQFRGAALRRQRLPELRRLRDTVAAGRADLAAEAAATHVAALREAVRSASA